jgi:DNA-binding response OmpR family regulator
MTINTVSTRPVVLVAEEDDNVRTFLTDQLVADRHEVHTATSREDALQLLASEPVDLVVVDVNGNTLDLIDAVRTGDGLAGHLDPAVPMIVLTARIEELHRIRVLDRGADDVLAKPFSYPELRARIAAVLRRTQPRPAPSILQVGILTIDRHARSVTVAGQLVEMPGKEYELLRRLASDPRRVFTRAELLADVWGAHYGMSRTVDSHVCRLRARLAAAGADRLLVNVWGVGYRLI